MSEMHWLPAILLENTLEALGVGAAIFGFGLLVGRFAGQRFERDRQAAGDATAERSDVETVKAAVNSEKLLWTRPVAGDAPRPIEVHDGGTPIITIANLKGGVGKTTIAANLAAYMGRELSRPALVMDFDYQGSLSNTLITAGFASDQRAHAATSGDYLKQGAEIADLALKTIKLNDPFDVELVPAFYELQEVENEIMLGWLSGVTGEDVRFRLCEVLSDQIFQSRFSAIIIDAPPRMTTGFINALCASTHLFIPTILDGLSSEAAGFFAKQVHEMRETLFPRLRLGGVIPSRTTGLTTHRLKPDEENVIHELNAKIGAIWGHPSPVLSGVFVPNATVFRDDAGRDVTLFGSHPHAKKHLDALGQKVCDVVGLQPK